MFAVNRCREDQHLHPAILGFAGFAGVAGDRTLVGTTGDFQRRAYALMLQFRADGNSTVSRQVPVIFVAGGNGGLMGNANIVSVANDAEFISGAPKRIHDAGKPIDGALAQWE